MTCKLIVSLFFFFQIFANPKGERVVKGDIKISSKERSLTIRQSSQKAIVEWKDFSIGLKEKVNIHQMHKNGAILNKVVGVNPSKIFGSLESNGVIYLVNERGILIGKEGKITAKGFLASCLNLKNEEFLSKKTLFFKGDTPSELTNLGTIKALGGSVFLFAKTVNNKGSITSDNKSVCIAGADLVYLTEDQQIFVGVDAKGKVNNSGSIKALSAYIEAAGDDIYSSAINHKGIIEATSVDKSEGRIVLKSGSGVTEISGSLAAISKDKGGFIEVSGGDSINIYDGSSILADGNYGGGTILIGGDYQGKNPLVKNTKNIWIGKGATISADALDNGDGGKVIVWGDDQNLFGGNISAKGGINGGDGGFVEVSSKNHLMYRGSVFTNAPNGKTGELLLDPSDITISGAASSPAFPTAPGVYNPAVAAATLNNSDLVNLVDGLGNNNVTISTSAGVGGAGIVTFAADVTWSAATTLTVNADQSVIVNSGITLSNTSAASNFTAFDLNGNGAAAASSMGVDIVGNINTVNGNINLVGQGGNGASNFGIYIRNTSTGLSSSGTGADAGTITLDGTGGTGNGSCFGVYIQGAGDRVTSVDGNISITGQGGGSGGSTNNKGIVVDNGGAIRSTGTGASAATITLDGTGSSAATTISNNGIDITGANSGISSIDGNISLTGVAGVASISSSNLGISLSTSAFLESTGTGANAATITLNGTGGGTASGRGVFISSMANFSSVEGDIDITGIGGGSTNSSDGVIIFGNSIESTGVGADAANIIISGTAGGTSGSGIEFFTSGGVISVDGDISFTVTGVGAESGFDMTSGTAFVGNGSTTGDISIITNTINLAGTVQSSGTLTIEPSSIASTIGLGSSSVGTLNFTNTELSNIQNGFTEIIFGRTDGTGAIDVRAFTYLDPVTIRSLSGTITVNGALAAGANDITLISDSMNILSSITSTGILTIEPGQTSTTIGLGTGAVGTLNLTSAEIANFTDGFSEIIFGITTQDSTVDMQAETYNDPITVYGKQIDVNGAISAAANDVTLNIGPASSGTFNLDALVTTSGTFSINGAGSNDAFNINVTGQTATLNGNGGTNTLTGPNVLSAWSITADNAGSLDSITFSNIDNLVGGSSTDTFTFNGAFQISGSIDGGAGTNTVTGPNVINAWSITADDAGTITPTGAIGPTTLTNITNLVGGSAADTFTFGGAFQISGGIDGSGGTNTVTGPNVVNAWSITADDTATLSPTGAIGSTSLTNITNLVGGSAADTFTFGGAFQISGGIDGGAGTNTVTGPNVINAWSITADDTATLTPTGAIGSTSLTNITNLVGGSAADTFTFGGAFQISGSIDGDGGSNTINGPNVVNAWSITADDTATLTPTGAIGSTSLTNITNLVGGSAADTFTFGGAFQISGSIDGDGGTNTVTGPNVINAWSITADDTATLTPTGAIGSTSLTNITNLVGGSAADTFTFGGAFQISGSIDGDGGSNTINGPNVNNTWLVTSQTTGTLTPFGALGATSYSNVATLVGNSADDTFNLSPDITLPAITAGAGTDTLTFLAGWTIAASVDLNTIIDFEVINGPPGLDNILTGNDLSNVWVITAANAGTLENTTYPSPTVFTFSNFPNLVGGTQSDIFDFTGGFTVSSIDGSTGTSTLLAPNTANIWNITTTNGGSVAGIAFTNITNLTGGSASDTFVFSNQQGITGRIDGGGAASLNTLDYSAFSPDAIVEFITATSGTASNLGNGFINIGNIIGNATTLQIIEKSKFYFTSLQLLFTELYHYRQIPEFFYRQFEKMKYVLERKEKVYIRRQNEINNALFIDELLYNPGS